jgi:hypothetical protein
MMNKEITDMFVDKVKELKLSKKETDEVMSNLEQWNNFNERQKELCKFIVELTKEEW